MSRTHLQRVFTTIGGLALAGTLALAQAAPVLFDVPLMGAQEVPAVQTPGQGNAALTYDASTRVVAWNITFSGLSSPATMNRRDLSFGVNRLPVCASSAFPWARPCGKERGGEGGSFAQGQHGGVESHQRSGHAVAR